MGPEREPGGPCFLVSAAPKNETKVRAGRAGAAARWGPGPRVVRLTDLPSPVADVVRAILAAQDHAAAKAE